MRPWTTIERIETREGPLLLRQRDERDFLITIAGRVLMTSKAHNSEDELARLACSALPASRTHPRILIGGLGMAYTLRAALNLLPRGAHVTVAELNPQVVAWCRGPLAVLTDHAVADPRVTVDIADVGKLIAEAPTGSYDAIVLDLYEGPHQRRDGGRDPLYGYGASKRALSALGEGGVLAVWSEEADRPYEDRLREIGFRVESHRSGHGGRVHVVYLAVRPSHDHGK